MQFSGMPIAMPQSTCYHFQWLVVPTLYLNMIRKFITFQIVYCRQEQEVRKRLEAERQKELERQLEKQREVEREKEEQRRKAQEQKEVSFIDQNLLISNYNTAI